MLDLNKLLVPTPPLRNDTAAWPTYNNLGVIEGALMSFSDAPGGLKEELQEIQISAGAEYWYSETFAVRAGYFYEHDNKGGRQYATVGVGIRYNYFTGDFSYLIPTTTISTNSLANTIRVSIGLDMKPSTKTAPEENPFE